MEFNVSIAGIIPERIAINYNDLATKFLGIYSENLLIQQGLSHDNMSDKRDCQNIESVTKIICNIHWNHNDTYNLVVYLFIFKNYETINDQIILIFVNYRHDKEILLSD